MSPTGGPRVRAPGPVAGLGRTRPAALRQRRIRNRGRSPAPSCRRHRPRDVDRVMWAAVVSGLHATAAIAAAWRAGAASPPLASDARDGLLRHYAHLLRECRAASRARVHDDRRRHPRPPSPPAWRGRLLPHGHGRAWRAGRAGGRERGHHAEGARGSQRPALPGPAAAHQRVQRLLHPHLRPASQAARPGGHAARARQRTRLQGPLRGLVLPQVRRLQVRRRDRRGEHVQDPRRHAARPRARGELVLPAVDASSSRSRTSTRSGPTSSPRAPGTTRRSRSSTAASRTCRSRARS